jgi:regulatory protein YycI of two-component signal transduction system YycFG
VDRLDHLRIQILGLTLTGDTGEWFIQTVDTNDLQSETWDFESEILTMKEQFVYQASAQDTAQQYNELLQSKKSTMEYYNSM